MKKFEVSLYMVVDTTHLEHTRVLKVAPLKLATLWGKFYQAQGLIVTAPPLEGRSFSKFDKLPLQYLYWNTCGQQTPPEDYGELVQQCLTQLYKMEVSDVSEDWLANEIDLIAPDPTRESGRTETGSHGQGNETAVAVRPGKNSTTGAVWIIADEQFVKAGNQFPERKAVIEACVHDGINASTASTQYSKWVKAKRIEISTSGS